MLLFKPAMLKHVRATAITMRGYSRAVSLYEEKRKEKPPSQHAVSIGTINANVKNANYAVRGPILIRSMELAKQLEEDPDSLPFKRLISCNIGNPQALQQKPISFFRDVISLFANPSLIERAPDVFKADVIERAKSYIASVPSAGAYTESAGIRLVRNEVAAFLHQRDGYPSDPNNIILTSGASDAVRFCINCVLRPPISGYKDALMAPIPQYPLYMALTALHRGSIVPYYPDESKGWACTPENMTEALRKAEKEQGLTCKAMVVINPGNPTGQVLSEENVREVVAWCQENGIFLIADEVYQENIHKDGAKFVSFRKVAHDMGAFEGEKKLQLASMHTVSKGFVGECGFRGGYCEFLGIPADVQAQILKLSSINLCPNTMGQVMIGLMSNPPKPGDPSHEQYVSERDAIKDGLKLRAKKLSSALNALDRMSCTEIEGAMYAFPSIDMPEKAIAKAKEHGVAPDFMYSMRLLEETGVVVVPGSGFGQAAGTHHFRTTILPPDDMMDEVMDAITKFNKKFMEEFA